MGGEKRTKTNTPYIFYLKPFLSSAWSSANRLSSEMSNPRLNSAPSQSTIQKENSANFANVQPFILELFTQTCPQSPGRARGTPPAGRPPPTVRGRARRPGPDCGRAEQGPRPGPPRAPAGWLRPASPHLAPTAATHSEQNTLLYW